MDYTRLNGLRPIYIDVLHQIVVSGSCSSRCIPFTNFATLIVGSVGPIFGCVGNAFGAVCDTSGGVADTFVRDRSVGEISGGVGDSFESYRRVGLKFHRPRSLCIPSFCRARMTTGQSTCATFSLKRPYYSERTMSYSNMENGKPRFEEVDGLYGYVFFYAHLEGIASGMLEDLIYVVVPGVCQS